MKLGRNLIWWVVLVGVLSAQESADTLELGEVVVTGTRTLRLATEAPVRTEVVSAERLADFQAGTLAQALKLVPSARFENECQNCGLNQIQLLGLSTDYTAVLFDGAPLYAGLAKVYGADLFPTQFLDRIEVVKGGASVLYGPEAIAGVVNFISASPTSTGARATFRLAQLGGEALETEATLIGDWVGPEAQQGVTGYVLTRERESLDLTGDGFSELAEFVNLTTGARAFWQTKDGLVRVSYQFTNQNHRGGDQLELPEERARVAESLAHRIHLLQTAWEHSWGPDLTLHLRASLADIRRESFYGARADNAQRAYEDAGFSGEVTPEFEAAQGAAIDAVARRVWGLTENRVYFAEAQVDHRWGRHTTSYGVQWRLEELTDGSLYDLVLPETFDSFGNLGAYIQDQWALADHWEVVLGLRGDRHDHVEGAIYSPRLAVRWLPNSEWTVRASWSTGFNAPGAFNEDAHIGVNNGGAIRLVNAPNLEEERSQTWSAGLDYRPRQFRGLTVNTAFHYTALEGAYEVDDTGALSGDPDVWLRINGPDATYFVWETAASWSFAEHWRIEAGASWLHAELAEAVERVPGLTTTELPQRPRWTGFLGATYENDETGWEAHALLNYTGPMLAIAEDAGFWRRTERFFVLDLGLSRRFEGWPFAGGALTVAAGLENAFDDRQEDVENNGEERDPTYLYGPSQPRAAYLRIGLEW